MTNIGWVVVTGASRGIGRQVAIRLVQDGFGVIGVARQLTGLEATAEEISSNERFAYRALDLSEHEASIAFWSELRQRYRVVGLVNNAGAEMHGPAEAVTASEFGALLGVNLVGPYVSCVEAFKTFAGNGGSIVNIASVDAHRGMAQMAAYCASKAGLVGLTRALAVEWARHGVRVNSVSPGAVRTDMTSVMTEDSKAYNYLVGRTPQRRFGAPNEIVGAVSYLMSSDATFVTGADLAVDGGFLA